MLKIFERLIIKNLRILTFTCTQLVGWCQKYLEMYISIIVFPLVLPSLKKENIYTFSGTVTRCKIKPLSIGGHCDTLSNALF